MTIAVLDGRTWLVLEVDGARPLSDLLDAQPLDIATVLKIGISLAGLLEALHAGGIAHNNITPYSIWGDLGTGAARITDFALAGQMPEISRRSR